MSGPARPVPPARPPAVPRGPALLGAVLPGAVLLGAILLGTAGCGRSGDEVSSYCAHLRADREAFAMMLADSSPGALVDRLPMLQELADAAPSDLRDEWQAFVAPVRGLRGALQDAGVAPEEFDGGTPPSGLPSADAAAIRRAADGLSAAPVVAAAAGIDQQARDVCKVNLGM